MVERTCHNNFIRVANRNHKFHYNSLSFDNRLLLSSVKWKFKYTYNCWRLINPIGFKLSQLEQDIHVATLLPSFSHRNYITGFYLSKAPLIDCKVFLKGIGPCNVFVYTMIITFDLLMNRDTTLAIQSFLLKLKIKILSWHMTTSTCKPATMFFGLHKSTCIWLVCICLFCYQTQ